MRKEEYEFQFNKAVKNIKSLAGIKKLNMVVMF